MTPNDFMALINVSFPDSQVISKGSSIGPAGITLTLKKEGKDGVVQVVTSGEGGGFLFTQILPGSYIVQATHAAWTFEKV